MRRVHHPDHDDHRSALRALGWLLTMIGGGFTAVGFFSFFAAFGGGGIPDKFWCAFVGLPLLGLGTMLLKAGYLGVMSRYVAGETAPVLADTADYVLGRTKRGVRRVTQAIAEGQSSAAAEALPTKECGVCRAPQRAEAKFCDACGAAMTSTLSCPSCRHENQPGARFCSGCGVALTG
jgi:hypothetical protein